jgi:four helix bundle protein
MRKSIYSIKICESEASETQYWLELVGAAGWLPERRLAAIHKESSDLLTIFTAIAKKK